MENTSDTVTPRYSDSGILLRGMEDAEIRRLIPTVVLLSVIAVTGMFGNGIVIHVYRTRYKISNSKLFIISVGAIDLLSCCVAIPLEIPLLLEQYTFEQEWLCKISRLFNTLCTCSSSFILLFIAIDRYRKVCKPLGKQITPNVAKILCVLSVALGILVAWPAIFVYGKKTFEILTDSGIYGSECSTSDDMSQSRIPFYYAMLFGLLFIAGITSMSVLYCLIGFKIRRQARKMSQAYSFRSMSVPMTSSIIVDKDRIRRSDDVGLPRYEKNKNGNNSKSKYNKRRDSSNDDSWTDRKDFELSYEYSESQSKYNSLPRNGLEKSTTLTSVGESIPEHVPASTQEEQINDENIPDVNKNDKNNESDKDLSNGKNISSTEEKSDTTKNDEPNTIPGNKNDEKRYSSESFTSSGEIIPSNDRSIRQRVSSVGSRISNAFMRLTSIGSVTTDSEIGILRKNQYLKEARARKTAFVMFVISLAYIISYLPHLILMVTRQINGDFVDNLSDSRRATYKFFLRSYFLNCAINPIIYGVCDSRFRSACAELFRKCRPRSK